MASSYLEPVSPAVRALLDVLQQLPPLRFPEADGRSIDDVAAEARVLAAEARRLDEEAERAYRALAVHQSALQQKAARARRYARIFAEAEGRKDVIAALDAIDLGVDTEAVTVVPVKTKKKATKKAA